MKCRVVPWIVLFAATTLVASAQVGIGDSRSDVAQRVGPPVSRAVRGDHEILLYPHGGRIEFIQGKVVDVKGPLPAPALKPASVAAGGSDSHAARGGVVQPIPQPPPSTAPQPTPAAVAAPRARPDAGQDIAASIPRGPEAALALLPAQPPAPRGFSWEKFGTLVFLHVGVTLIALRVAFKIKEMDAFWSGTLAIAGIDGGLYALLEGLGPLSGGITSMGAVESGLGTLVMIGTVRAFCINKRLQNAVVTALSVKLIVRLCHMFLFVLVVNGLFG